MAIKKSLSNKISNSLKKTGARSGISTRYHRREILALALSAVIIGGIFFPYPDINAVQVKLTHRNINDDSTGLNLQVVAQDPSAITFGNGLRSETIPMGEIRVTLDPGTVNEKTAIFDFNGNLLSDNSGGTITGLTFDGVTHHHQPGTFGTGYFYGYGAGFFSGTFTKGEIGDGSTVTGISSQPYGQDTIASYQVNFNPMLLPTGTHIIRVDVLAHPGDQNFFSTGDVSFHSKQITSTGKVTGNGHLGKDVNFEFDVSSKDSTTFKGTLDYHDKNAHIDLGSTRITSLSVDNSLTQVLFMGQAEIKRDLGGHGKKNTSMVTFSVNVTDPDKKGDHDTFAITLTDSNGATIYQNSGTVQGHIEIHTTDTDDKNSRNTENKQTQSTNQSAHNNESTGNQNSSSNNNQNSHNTSNSQNQSTNNNHANKK